MASYTVKLAALCLLACCINAAKLPGHDTVRRGYSYEPPAPQPPHNTYFAPSPSPPDNSYLVPDVPDNNPMSMPFAFGYGVEDDEAGVNFGHQTNSDGSHTTGEYEVLLPDGRKQIVTYTVDNENGYQAEVKYEGEARPYVAPEQTYQQPQQIYQQPQQTYQQPQQTYQQPQQTYKKPQQTHQLPQQTYQVPQHEHQAPQLQYNLPNKGSSSNAVGYKYEAPKPPSTLYSAAF